MTSQVDINEYAEGAVLLDGLEEAIIGIVEEFGNGRRLLYSKSKILSILCERDLMTIEEAEEFYYYNILGLSVINTSTYSQNSFSLSGKYIFLSSKLFLDRKKSVAHLDLADSLFNKTNSTLNFFSKSFNFLINPSTTSSERPKTSNEAS
jgi:hypothetical protein